jgi:hypothetical protein
MSPVESVYQLPLSLESTKRFAIADLPSDISVGPHKIGKSRYWRVRLGTRFTGGKKVEMHFPTLRSAEHSETSPSFSLSEKLGRGRIEPAGSWINGQQTQSPMA